jgi:hypothetical protein
MQILLFHPKSETADECVGIVSLAAAAGQFLELFHVSAAKHDSVWLQGSGQAFHHIGHILSPLLLAETFQTANAQGNRR